MRRLALAMFALGLGACGAAAPKPRDTFVAFADAVRDHDDTTAYRLLSEELRARLSPQELSQMLDADREALVERARRLSDAPALTSARVITRRTEPVLLTLTEDGWRIESGVGFRASTRTPRDAALAFAQALSDRDLDAILRLLSRARREEIDGQMRLLAEQLGKDARIEVVTRGMDHATVRMPNGDTLELVLENGEWRVDDLM